MIAVKAGSKPFDGALIRNPHGLRRRGPERAFPMRKRTTVTVKVNVDVASCLFGIAAILHIFF